MTTIVTRSEKGSALTYGEVDSNFTNLNTAKYVSADTDVPVTGVSATGAVGSVAVTGSAVVIPAAVVAYATVHQVNVWASIDDTQTANWNVIVTPTGIWTPINDQQTPVWTEITPSTSPVWAQVAAAQAASWGATPEGQSPSWQQIAS